MKVTPTLYQNHSWSSTHCLLFNLADSNFEMKYFLIFGKISSKFSKNTGSANHHRLDIILHFRCVSSDECHECIKTMQSFLTFMNEKKSFSEFVEAFTQLSFTARISGNLKIGLIQFLADLVPHYNLIKYVMDSKRQNHEYLRNMNIYWLDNIDALSNAITRTEYNKVILYIYYFHLQTIYDTINIF